ncbi:MAG: TolC family protein [Firmicutes bacterium]|nr:TolC family protein [Bacillota bacterium]
MKTSIVSRSQSRGGKRIAAVLLAGVMVACLVAATGMAAGETPVLSLEDAYQQALKSSTVIAQSRLAVKQAELSADQAEETAHSLDERFVTTWDLRLVKYYNPENAASALETARTSDEITRKQMQLTVADAYYNVLKAEAMFNAQVAGVKRAEEQLESAKASFEAGLVPRTDVLAAEVGVSSAKVSLASASKARDMAVMSLNQLLGNDLSRKVAVAAEFKYDTPKAGDPSQVVANALGKRLDIRKASESLRMAELYHKLALDHFSPNVWTVKQAAINVESTRLGLDIARQAAELEIRLQHQSLLEADERYHLTVKSLEQASENLRLAQLRYDSGVGTSLEVTSADSTLRQIEAQAIQAQFDYALAAAKWEFLKEGGHLSSSSMSSSAGSGSSSGGASSGSKPSGMGF